MPAKVIKIPLSTEFYQELDDSFIDREESLEKFIFTTIKKIVKDAKTGKLAKKLGIQTLEKGQLKNDTVKLKDINLSEYSLSSNPTWLPEDVEASEVKYIDYKVTDKTHEYLVLYFQMLMYRIEVYNKSTRAAGELRVKDAQEKYDKAPVEDKTKELQILTLEKTSLQTTTEQQEKQLPECFEMGLHQQVFPQLHKIVMENIDKEFDKEFEEMYPEDGKKKDDKKEEPKK